ncbi:MAG: LacI family transcriptional regulator [Gaiellales bacterium]|jgi:LacI family transcriptional regulator|nr:LacI family transcriptional regulator [Gaiellales bacterium]
MRVTMREVAAKAGVSAMTVSRVINDSRSVSEDARRRVEAAIAELAYVPNRLASGLIRRKTGAIGLIVPDVANPFFTLVVRGAEEVAWRAGYHVILCNTQADLERERGYLEDMLAFQVEGLLIAPVGERSKSNLRIPRKNGVPFVLIDRSLHGYQGDLVQGDSIAEARRLVEHLIGLGHRRIAMVTEPGEVSTARDREQGYRQALEQADIPFRPEFLAQSSAIDPREARDSTLALLSLREPPTAIFSVNNIAVVGVAEALRERGLDVPKDVALVCFDDIEHASRFFPFLTVMSQPAETFGTIATQLLLDRLAGRVPERGRLVVLPADFIVRQSCGAQLVAAG